MIARRSLAEPFPEPTVLAIDAPTALSLCTMLAILVERAGGSVEFLLNDVVPSAQEMGRARAHPEPKFAIVDNLDAGTRTITLSPAGSRRP